MKNSKDQNLIQTFLICSIIVVSSLTTQGQWLMNNPNGDNSVNTDNSGNQITAVGIGDYRNNSDWPKAALDICIPYLQSPATNDWWPNGSASRGEAIHSSVYEDYDHYWRMFTITNSDPHPGIEKFHIENYRGNSNDIELNVAQRGNMEFFTDNTHWMRLRSQGNLGLSNEWTNFTPVSLFHLNQDGTSDVYQRFTNNGSTGITTNDGFRLGITYNGFTSVADLNQMENSHMRFFTNNTQRMRIDSLGNVSINTNNNRAILNVFGQNNITASAWRDGIMMYNHSAIVFDADSINYSGNRYYFMAAPAYNPQGDIFHGLVPGLDGSATPQYVYQLYNHSRIGEPTQGHHRFRTTLLEDSTIGVGTLFPAKRVEIVDGDTTQLRLTRLQRNSTYSITTDFQTTNAGDLYINPHDSITAKSLGINKFSPITTLHVGGTAGSTGAITSDYLNHSATPSAPGSNPWLVYSDANGTLKNLPVASTSTDVLHGNGTWGAGGSGNVSVCGGASANYVPIFSSTVSTICNSQIFDNGTEVGVNYGSSPPSGIKFSVNGDINIAANQSYDIHDLPFLKTNGYDVELGYNAGPTAANSSQYSIYIGGGAGASIANTEVYNTFVGTDAGGHTVAASGPTGGDRNVCIGSAAGYGAATGHGRENVFIGVAAGGQYSHLNEYDQNVVVGGQAGNTSNDLGTQNTILGYGSHVNNSGSGQIDNAVVIGYNTYTTSDNAFVCGNSDNRILMGYTAIPSVDTSARLYVSPVSGPRAAYFNGTISTTGVYTGSDITLKQNIQPMPDVTPILDQLAPKTYTFNQATFPEMNLPSGLQYGLIADDVEAFLPGLVETEAAPPIFDSLNNLVAPTHTYKALNYPALIPILIQGLKQQKDRIDQLEQLINNCCNLSPATPRIAKPAINVELSNSIILNQNDPNPFAEETKITYNIPEGISDAKIIFFDNTNHIIQTVKINERGEGQLNVYASNLTSGIYNYSLIADGKVIDTKKMVCTK